MRKAFDHFTHLHFDSQLLPQLADKAFLECFVRLAFAARKFPQTAQVRPHMPLRDQQFSLAKNQAGRDFDIVSSRRL